MRFFISIFNTSLPSTAIKPVSCLKNHTTFRQQQNWYLSPNLYIRTVFNEVTAKGRYNDTKSFGIGKISFYILSKYPLLFLTEETILDYCQIVYKNLVLLQLLTVENVLQIFVKLRLQKSGLGPKPLIVITFSFTPKLEKIKLSRSYKTLCQNHKKMTNRVIIGPGYSQNSQKGQVKLFRWYEAEVWWKYLLILKNNESFMPYGTKGYFNSEDVLTQP